MPAAIPIAIGVSAATGLAGGIMQSGAAKNAAKTQADSAKYAADLEYKASQDALAFQKDMWNTQQQNLAPWLKAGTGAIGTLSTLTSTPGAGLLTPWTEEFKAPTAITEQNDPGFQFRLQQGMDALQRSAAAKGNLLTGGTAKGLNGWAQDYASNEYGNVYNRAMQEYMNRYNTFENNQTNTFNRLASVAGMGQTSASNLNATGTATANNVSSNLLNTAGMMGQAYQNAGAATASGYIGSANAWANSLNNLGGLPMQYMLMNKLMGANS